MGRGLPGTTGQRMRQIRGDSDCQYVRRGIRAASLGLASLAVVPWAVGTTLLVGTATGCAYGRRGGVDGHDCGGGEARGDGHCGDGGEGGGDGHRGGG